MLCIAGWLEFLLKAAGSNTSGPTDHLYHVQEDQLEALLVQVQKILRVDVIPLDQLSSKFNALARILLDHQQKDEPVQDLQAIVFVERRAIAHLVPSLLERSAGLKGFIRAVALTGHASSNDDQDFIGVKMDSKTQNKTVSRFRTGEYNLTVATSVAEEGLDFRSCSLVIRFDQITTWKG